MLREIESRQPRVRGERACSVPRVWDRFQSRTTDAQVRGVPRWRHGTDGTGCDSYQLLGVVPVQVCARIRELPREKITTKLGPVSPVLLGESGADLVFSRDEVSGTEPVRD
ncbi:hypothetical protein GCM10009612_71250 [Streptomyces beijiangensis]